MISSRQAPAFGAQVIGGEEVGLRLDAVLGELLSDGLAHGCTFSCSLGTGSCKRPGADSKGAERTPSGGRYQRVFLTAFRVATVEVELTVPKETPPGIGVTLTATGSSNPDITNGASFEMTVSGQ